MDECGDPDNSAIWCLISPIKWCYDLSQITVHPYQVHHRSSHYDGNIAVLYLHVSFLNYHQHLGLKNSCHCIFSQRFLSI